MTPPEQGFPPELLDASKTMTSDSFKQKYDENALILKTTYWYEFFSIIVISTDV